MVEAAGCGAVFAGSIVTARTTTRDIAIKVSYVLRGEIGTYDCTSCSDA